MTSDAMARIQGLVLALRAMSEEIEPELHVVSTVTCQEWKALQGTWPSDSELREGTPGLTEEQLETIVAKTRRFKDIVHELASRIPRRRLHEDAHHSRTDAVAPPMETILADIDSSPKYTAFVDPSEQ